MNMTMTLSTISCNIQVYLACFLAHFSRTLRKHGHERSNNSEAYSLSNIPLGLGHYILIGRAAFNKARKNPFSAESYTLEKQ